MSMSTGRVCPTRRREARGRTRSGYSPSPASIHAQAARAQAAASQAGHPARPSRAALTAAYHPALATGFSRAYLVAAGIMLLALVITIVAIKVKRTNLGEARH